MQTALYPICQTHRTNGIIYPESQEERLWHRRTVPNSRKKHVRGFSQVYPAAQVARELGINVNSLYSWMSRFKAHPADPFVGSGNLHQEDAELRALKKRIKDLEEENEFLK